MKTVFAIVRAVTLWLGGITLALMALQVTVDVALRATRGVGLPATSDIVSMYWMVVVSFLPVAYAEIHQRNVAVSALVDRAPGWIGLLSRLLAYVLSLAVYGLLTYQTVLEAVSRTRRGTFVEVGTLKLPVWQSYWVLPVSFALMVLVLLLTRLRRSGDTPDDLEAMDHAHAD
ncbi:MAG: TRAP transporter small permease [Pseudomonadota bacterium]|nr:TRAP transporter small permease [Pseudomonadota bacterium]